MVVICVELELLLTNLVMLGIYTSADRSDILTYNSCYAYYNSEWNAMTDLVSSNLSSAILPNLSFVSPSNTAVDENMDSKLTVYYSNNILNILNATPGLFISVYDMLSSVTCELKGISLISTSGRRVEKTSGLITAPEIM